MKLRRITAPRRRRWTREEYYRLADLGFFRGQRVELIQGEIVTMPAFKYPHVAATTLAEDALRDAFGPGFWIRIQVPLKLGTKSDPEPDVAVVPGGPRDYTDHPTTALLIVEVSDTTLAYDRGPKAGIYARAGIADYWIINLVDRQLEVRRNPIPGSTRRQGYRFADVTILTPADHATPLAVPQARIAVADLLP